MLLRSGAQEWRLSALPVSKLSAAPFVAAIVPQRTWFTRPTPTARCRSGSHPSTEGIFVRVLRGTRFFEKFC